MFIYILEYDEIKWNVDESVLYVEDFFIVCLGGVVIIVCKDNKSYRV